MAKGIDEIASRVLSGDVNAFEEIIRRYEGEVAKIVSRRIPSCDIEDVSQEIFIAVFNSLSKLGEPPSNFEGWIRKIAINQCVNYWRQREKDKETNFTEIGDEHIKVLETVSSTFQEDTLEKLTGREEALLNELLDWALSKLSPIDRMIIELVFFEERGQKEVASLLGITVGSLKVRLFRAKRKLKKILKDKVSMYERR